MLGQRIGHQFKKLTVYSKRPRSWNRPLSVIYGEIWRLKAPQSYIFQVLRILSNSYKVADSMIEAQQNIVLKTSVL